MIEQLQVAAQPRVWPAGSLGKVAVALLCIDFQHDFCSPGGFADACGFNIDALGPARQGARRALGAARAAGWTVVHTRAGHRPEVSEGLLGPARATSRPRPGDTGPLGRYLVRGERGHDIVPELTPLPAETVIDKPGKGAFYATELDLMLRSRGVTHLVFTGVTSDVCVQSSYREAADRGYDCLWLSDATGSYWPDAHDAAVLLATAQDDLLGSVATTEALLAALENVPARGAR